MRQLHKIQLHQQCASFCMSSYSQKNRTSQNRINEKFAQSFSYIPVRMFTPGALTVKAQRVSQTNLRGSMSRAEGVVRGSNVTVVLSADILLCGF